jgi:tRNA A-37 threonylcarbamoyl transferase component Bud32
MLVSGSNTHEICHKNKSSDILVIPTEGEIIKIKERKPENTMKELIALGVIKTIFLNYPGTNIDSPLPISVDLPKNSLTMSYVPGVNGEEIISTNFTSTEGANKKSLLLDFVEHLGKLIRIKEDNNLIHGDFQLRHLVYEEASEKKPNPKLYLIDVENAKIEKSVIKIDDQFKYFDTLIKTLNNTELQIAQKKNNEPNHQALEHLHDVIAKHPLITEPLMQEHLNLLNQLFVAKSFLFQAGEKHIMKRGQENKTATVNRPLSIYENGDYPKSSNHIFEPHGLPKVSGSKMKEAYDFLDRLITGYDSIEDPVPFGTILGSQQALQRQFNTNVSIIN